MHGRTAALDEMGDLMSDQQPYGHEQHGQQPYGQQPYSQGGLVPAPTPYGSQAMAPHAMGPYAMGPGPIGRVRSTGLSMLLCVVTLGIYAWFWYYAVHEEMKLHTGQGIGGVVAILLAIFVTPVVPFLTSSEAGQLYARAGHRPPVSGLTGLWYFPGMFILVGPIIWFVQTNGAINEYWRSRGAAG